MQTECWTLFDGWKQNLSRSAGFFVGRSFSPKGFSVSIWLFGGATAGGGVARTKGPEYVLKSKGLWPLGGLQPKHAVPPETELLMARDHVLELGRTSQNSAAVAKKRERTMTTIS